jgi:hypothetical protein
MKIELSTVNTLPSKEWYFWQFTLIPTISILRMKHDIGNKGEVDEYEVDAYVIFNFEWLFWSVTILIK